MPAQPLKTKFPDGDVGATVHLDGGLFHRPNVAVKVAQCIAAATLCEVQLYRLYLLLMDSKADAAYATWEAIGGRRNRLSILKKVSLTMEFSIEERDLLNAIIRYCESVLSRRDLLAHGVWAHAETMPDHALLVEPKGMLKMDSAWIRKEELKKGESHPDIADYAWVYSASDCEELRKELEAADIAVDQFSLLISAERDQSEKHRELILSNEELRNRYKREVLRRSA